MFHFHVMLHIDVAPSSSNSSSSSHVTNSFSNRDASYEEVDYNELDFSDYHRLKRLGRGSYGTVLQATWRGKRVASKMVETDIDHETIHNEAKLLHELVHPNIIKLYAVFKGEEIGLILELMEGGSLHKLLHLNKHIKYYAEHVFGWAHQCASAVQYLHGKDLVHRDLKPSTMLLTNDYIGLKLCGFGTAAGLKTTMTNNRGTAAWMAPEVFRGKKYDQKCDIFSFGILMWEMLARRQPITDPDSHAYTILWQVSEGRRPPVIKDCPSALMDLIQLCWDDNPNKRPTIDEVVDIIDVIRKIYGNYDKPLIDLTTNEQAFAHASEIPRTHSQPIYDSEYMTTHSSSAPSETWLDDGQPTMKPPPLPPRLAPPMTHRRSGSDHAPVPAYQFPAYQPALQPTPPGSLRGVSSTNPPVRPTIPSIYAPSISTPLPNAMPYSPCLSATNNIAPQVPPYYHSISNPSGGNSTTNSQLLSANEIGWRRESEPPYDTASCSSIGATSTSGKKKKSGLSKLYKGLKKEIKELASNKP
uniref:Mitogen-activated protein kinase kinase kinase n=1 Tax=Acrobeloides nanus TaxID=290746 RepID=A0A914BWM5_9BILA